ncbi:MAG: RidA family protein [Eubacteriales bacterium]|nr:RidA family protein [Eubacteriales bacterium]
MKKIVNTTNAPSAIGPYSQGIQVGNLFFFSGQIPLDPATGSFPCEDIEGQTRQALTNVKALLESQGMTMDNVVKTTVFLKDIAEFTAMNNVYAEFFTEGNYPARSAVQVAALPKDARVEIEVIAAKED